MNKHYRIFMAATAFLVSSGCDFGPLNFEDCVLHHIDRGAESKEAIDTIHTMCEQKFS